MNPVGCNRPEPHWLVLAPASAERDQLLQGLHRTGRTATVRERCPDPAETTDLGAVLVALSGDLPADAWRRWSALRENEPTWARRPTLYLAAGRGPEDLSEGSRRGADLSLGQPWTEPELILALTALERMAERLQGEIQAVRARDELAHRMAHDLRSPLLAAGHIAELLERPGETARLPHWLPRLRDCLRRAGRLVDDQLLLARWEEAGARPRWEETDLPGLLREAAEGTAEEATRKRLQFSWLGPAEMPAVRADVPLLVRSASILLENAVRFAPADSNVRVDWGMTADGSAFLAVADEGPVPGPEERAALFERFPQRGMGEVRPPIGLALAVCQMAARVQGGDLDLSVREPRGLEFRLTWPG